MYDSVKDSGKREAFDTGAVRDTAEGKGRYDLLPAYALHRLARHFENGAVKYGDENWRKGIPLRRYLDSAIRHLLKYLEGHRDEDHAIAAAWNILALVETEEGIKRGRLPVSLNNLPNWLAPDEEAQDEKEAGHDLQPPDGGFAEGELDAIIGLAASWAKLNPYVAIQQDWDIADLQRSAAQWPDVPLDTQPKPPPGFVTVDPEPLPLVVYRSTGVNKSLHYRLNGTMLQTRRADDSTAEWIDEYTWTAIGFYEWVQSGLIIPIDQDVQGHAAQTASRFNAGQTYSDEIAARPSDRLRTLASDAINWLREN